jgi:hypothetical protein
MTAIDNIINFENQVKNLYTSDSKKINVSIDGDYIRINVDGNTIISRNDRKTRHQIGSRIWKDADIDTIVNNWVNLELSSPDELEFFIGKAIKDNNLVIKYFNDRGVLFNYGIVSPYYKDMNQRDLYNDLIHALRSNSNIELFADSSSIDSFYNRIKLKADNSKTGYEMIVHYPKNNGYDSFRIYWKRYILICTNGLLEYKNTFTNQLKHNQKINVREFIVGAVNNGIENRLITDMKIEEARLRNLQNQLLGDLFHRIHLAKATKNRIAQRLNEEILVTGNNEWSLSQAMTWLASHDKHIGLEPKKILKAAGTKVLELGLEKFLNDESSHKANQDKSLGVLLPTNFAYSF